MKNTMDVNNTEMNVVIYKLADNSSGDWHFQNLPFEHWQPVVVIGIPLPIEYGVVLVSDSTKCFLTHIDALSPKPNIDFAKLMLEPENEFKV